MRLKIGSRCTTRDGKTSGMLAVMNQRIVVIRTDEGKFVERARANVIRPCDFSRLKNKAASYSPRVIELARANGVRCCEVLKWLGE
jgi:hypothetical protein